MNNLLPGLGRVAFDTCDRSLKLVVIRHRLLRNLVTHFRLRYHNLSVTRAYVEIALPDSSFLALPRTVAEEETNLRWGRTLHQQPSRRRAGHWQRCAAGAHLPPTQEVEPRLEQARGEKN